jgi:DNA-3-methyladenine glycosylase II
MKAASTGSKVAKPKARVKQQQPALALIKSHVNSRTSKPSTRIETDDDVKAGIKSLRRRCDFIRAAHDATGHPPLRRRPGGFEGLVRIVNGQQLSVASANAIHARLEASLAPLTAAAVLAASDETLRACGLSRPKVKTIRAIAAAVAAGLDLDSLADLPEVEAMARLTAIPGIGPWTAEIYLMFCVGHADVFASGDLALQLAAQWLMGLDQRPGARQMAALAERWKPHRAVAARVLWAYYAARKKQGSATPV